MKRRVLSMLLAMCLLLSLLPMPSMAEEWAEVAESAIPAEEAAELPAEEPPSIEEAEPPEEAEPQPEEEHPPVEEEPQPEEEPPIEEEPMPEEELPQVAESDAELAEEIPDEWPALGSSGAQYAGVAYLSQGAFASMSEAGREVYMNAVDEITDLLDRGVPLYDVVFALYEDGDVAVHFTTPVLRFAEEEAPVAIAAGELLEAPESPEFFEEAEEREPDPEEAPAIRAENVELIESLRQPIVRVRGAASRSIAPARVTEVPDELEEFADLYAQSKEFFCDQLSVGGQAAFDLAKASIIDGGGNSFEEETRAQVDSGEVLDAISALINTYPWGFDWSDGYLLFDADWDEESGSSNVSVDLTVSEYYDTSLERQAQAKVAELIDAGLDSARKNYPHDVAYGLVRYFDQWICAHNYYNTDGMYPSDGWGGTGDQVFYFCHSSYGTLLKGYGVCESYAKAMARLLDAAGIPNLYAVGVDHAWNNVQMCNEKYYLLDSTWNDQGTTTRSYLLSGGDSQHKPDGTNYPGSMRFSFPTLPKSRYTPSKGPLTLAQSELCLRKGKSATLTLANSAYKNEKKSWKSSDTKVAKVSGGKVTAVGPGTATITLSSGSQAAECAVYVYQVSDLRFDEGGAASLTCEYAWEDEPQPQLFRLHVAQNGYLDTAENIDARTNHRELSCSSSKESVATAEAKLSGDDIELVVTPKGMGDATIKIGFGGKSATLKFQVRRALKDEWFRLEYDRAVYSGKAIKPAIAKSAGAPSNLKYSVKYANNTNAGEGIVTITGKNGYGTLEKHFTIQPAPIEGAVKITDTKAVYYNGAGQSASPTIKMGKKKLKAGVDYAILYDDSEEAPTRAGTYSLRFVGKNYDGDFSDGAGHSFAINPTPLGKLSLSLKKSSIKQNGAPVSAELLGLKLKYGKKEIPASEYEVSFRDSKGNTISAPSAPGSYKVVIRPTGTNLLPTDKKPELAKSFKIKK